MEKNSLELTDLRQPEKENETSFPALIQLVQNTREMKDSALTRDKFFGTIGDFNLPYSINIDENARGNLLRLRNAINSLKSVKLSRKHIFRDFTVLTIPDYASETMSIGQYDFVPLVYIPTATGKYAKLAQKDICVIRSFQSKEAFILINKKFNDTQVFKIQIRFKRARILDSNIQIQKLSYNHNTTDANGNDVLDCIHFKVVSPLRPLSSNDIEQIHFKLGDRQIYISDALSSIIIRTGTGSQVSGNPVEKQLSENDYFKLLYTNQYTPVTFASHMNGNMVTTYTAGTEEFYVDYYPPFHVTQEIFEKIEMVIGENTPDYYYLENVKASNVSNFAVYDDKGDIFYCDNSNDLTYLFLTGDPQCHYSEFFPRYDDYDVARFSFKHKTTVGETELPINLSAIEATIVPGVLANNKVYNYDDSTMVYDYFTPDGLKLDVCAEDINLQNYDNLYVVAKFKNRKHQITSEAALPTTTIVETNFSMASPTGNTLQVPGDPLAINRKSWACTLDNPIYLFDGDDARIRAVKDPRELAVYTVGSKKIISYDGTDFSPYRLTSTNRTYVLDKYLQLRAETLQSIYDRTHQTQSDFDSLKSTIALANASAFETAPNLVHTYTSPITTDLFNYMLIKSTGSDVLTITIKDYTNTDLKIEYDCQVGPDQMYVHIPFYTMVPYDKTYAYSSTEEYYMENGKSPFSNGSRVSIHIQSQNNTTIKYMIL